MTHNYSIEVKATLIAGDLNQYLTVPKNDPWDLFVAQLLPIPHLRDRDCILRVTRIRLYRHQHACVSRTF